MLKRSLTCVCAALAALFIIALPAGASTFGGSTKATIPFDFVISGKAMPADVYSFEMKAGCPTIAIRGSKGNSVLVFLSRRTGNYQNPPKPQLVFEKRESRYVLKEVWSTTSPARNAGK